MKNLENQSTCTNYDEEAIPERDPAYRLPEGTLSDTKTIDYMSGAERLALVRSLEQLGMNPARAAIVVSLG